MTSLMGYSSADDLVKSQKWDGTVESSKCKAYEAVSA
jgi:hypothetical protein